MAAEAALSNVIILTSIFEYLRNIPYYLSTDVSVWSGNSLLGLEKRRENVTNALCVNKTWAEYGTCVVWKEARCGQFMQLRPERRYYYARKIRQIAIYRSLTQEQVDMFKATLLTGLTDLNLYAEKVADFRNVMDVLGVGMNNLRRLHLHGPVAQTAEAGEEICEIIKRLYPKLETVGPSTLPWYYKPVRLIPSISRITFHPFSSGAPELPVPRDEFITYLAQRPSLSFGKRCTQSAKYLSL